MGYSLDIAGTMLIISLLYMMGPRGLFVEFRGGVSLALLCQMIWTGKWHRRSGCMTVAEWMTFRFGQVPGRQLRPPSNGGVLHRFRGEHVGLHGKRRGAVPFAVYPFVAVHLLPDTMLGIATLYTAMSGLYGVVVSDLFQCGLIVLGVLVRNFPRGRASRRFL